jgi:acyl-coenzyme A synthetase/AMP-(fatty) acid ligase
MDEMEVEINHLKRNCLQRFLFFLRRKNNGLPKTRSGKIMRGILRKVEAKEISERGDTSLCTPKRKVRQ